MNENNINLANLNQNQTDNMKPSKNNNKILLIIIGVLLVVGVFAVLYFSGVFNKKVDDSKENEQNEEPTITQYEPTEDIVLKYYKFFDYLFAENTVPNYEEAFYGTDEITSAELSNEIKVGFTLSYIYIHEEESGYDKGNVLESKVESKLKEIFGKNEEYIPVTSKFQLTNGMVVNYNEQTKSYDITGNNDYAFYTMRIKPVVGEKIVHPEKGEFILYASVGFVKFEKYDKNGVLGGVTKLYSDYERKTLVKEFSKDNPSPDDKAIEYFGQSVGTEFPKYKHVFVLEDDNYVYNRTEKIAIENQE